MIEIQFDMNEIERALDKLYGSKKLLSEAVSSALSVTVPEVRKRVIGVLKDEVTVGERFIKRAVKTAQIRSGLGEFRVVSKRLFLDDYELSPRVPTARPGMQSRNWPGFSYKLRRSGKTYHSFDTPTGGDGTGSKPFLGITDNGTLRVMYRRNPGHVEEGQRDVYLSYAPPIQYHAVAPEVEETARETSMLIFNAALERAVDNMLNAKGKIKKR